MRLRPAQPDDALAALYVHPDNWNRRVGVALIDAARAHLVHKGCDRAYLWLLAGNARAARFYSIDVWRPTDENRTEVVWGITVSESRYIRALRNISA